MRLLPPPRSAPSEHLRLIHVAPSGGRARFGARWWHKWIGVFVGIVLVPLSISGIAALLPVVQDGTAATPAVAINWGEMAISPAQAAHMASAGTDSLVRSILLRRIRDSITYAVRLKTGATWFVDAHTGRLFKMTDSLAAKIAVAGLGPKAVERVERRASRPPGYRGAMPAWLVQFDDAAGTQVYVAEVSGDVVRTTLRERQRDRIFQAAHNFTVLDDVRGGARIRKVLLFVTCVLTVIYAFLGFWLALPRRIRGRSR